MEGAAPLRRAARIGAFEVDFQRSELRKDGLKLKLQEQPFRVLTMLLERPGETVTREELKDALWPDETFVDFENSLNTAVNKLRATLGDSATSPRFVQTVPRRGYRFVAPVELEMGHAAPVPQAPRSFRTPLLVVAGLFVVSVAVLIGLLMRTRAENASSRPASVTRFSMQVPWKGTRWGIQQPNLAISPDGSRFVFVGKEAGHQQLYLREMAEPGVRPTGTRK